MEGDLPHAAGHTAGGDGDAGAPNEKSDTVGVCGVRVEVYCLTLYISSIFLSLYLSFLKNRGDPNPSSNKEEKEEEVRVGTLLIYIIMHSPRTRGEMRPAGDEERCLVVFVEFH